MTGEIIGGNCIWNESYIWTAVVEIKLALIIAVTNNFKSVAPVSRSWVWTLLKPWIFQAYKQLLKIALNCNDQSKFDFYNRSSCIWFISYAISKDQSCHEIMSDKHDNFLLQRDLQDNTLLLADQKFPDLMSIVTALRDDALLANCRQLLITPCPGLPLNAVFTGYKKGTARRGGRGRGKQLK